MIFCDVLGDPPSSKEDSVIFEQPPSRDLNYTIFYKTNIIAITLFLTFIAIITITLLITIITFTNIITMITDNTHFHHYDHFIITIIPKITFITITFFFNIITIFAVITTTYRINIINIGFRTLARTVISLNCQKVELFSIWNQVLQPFFFNFLKVLRSTWVTKIADPSLKGFLQINKDGIRNKRYLCRKHLNGLRGSKKAVTELGQD